MDVLCQKLHLKDCILADGSCRVCWSLQTKEAKVELEDVFRDTKEQIKEETETIKNVSSQRRYI